MRALRVVWHFRFQNSAPLPVPAKLPLRNLQHVTGFNFHLVAFQRMGRAVLMDDLSVPSNDGAVVVPEDQAPCMVYFQAEHHMKAPHFSAFVWVPALAAVPEMVAPVNHPA